LNKFVTDALMHLHDLTIKKLHEGLLNKEFKAAEITKGYFDYIKKLKIQK